MFFSSDREKAEEGEEEEDDMEADDEGFEGDVVLPASPRFNLSNIEIKNNGEEFAMTEAEIEEMLTDENMRRDFPDWYPGWCPEVDDGYH